MTILNVDWDKKLAGWKAKTLSVVGKVILTKSNLIGIPQYNMDWFRVAKYICKDIDGIKRNFF